MLYLKALMLFIILRLNSFSLANQSLCKRANTYVAGDAGWMRLYLTICVALQT